MLESGVFEIVSGDNLRGLCAQRGECFVDDCERVSMKSTWFAQIGGEFFVSSYLVWDHEVHDFKLKLGKVDGKRVGDAFDCQVKENINYKVHKNTMRICHGKVSNNDEDLPWKRSTPGHWAHYNFQSTEEWFPERGIVVPRVGSECPPRHHDRVVGGQRPHAQNALGQVLGSPGAGPGGRCHDRPSHEGQWDVGVGRKAIAGTIVSPIGQSSTM